MIENIDIMDIIERTKKYSGVVLYGAGLVAEEISRVLTGEGINIRAVVVSKKGDADALNGIPVYEADEYGKNITDDVLVIVAVSRKYRDEIVGKLDGLQIREYICASDYLTDGMPDRLPEVCDKEACERWWAGVQILARYLPDMNLSRGKSHARDGSRNIVMASDPFVKPRTVKLARALSKNGYKVHLLVYALNGNDPLRALDALKGSRVCVEHMRSVGEMVSYCMNCNAELLHIFSEGTRTYFFKELIAKKSLLPPVIFEMYDIMNRLYIPFGLEDKEVEILWGVERFCFENADGVCVRDFSMDYLEKNCKIKFPSKRLMFLDYYDRDDEVLNESNDNGLSLCYAGNIRTEREAPDMSESCYLDMADLCEKNRCHFYVYPSVWNEERLSDYIRLDKESEYFHLCRPVAFGNLCREISKYDYGITPIRSGFDQKEKDANHFKAKHYYSMANKHFDYLQSGLPIVAGEPVKEIEMLESDGMAINWCLEDFDFDELRRRRKEMKANVIKNRHKFSIQCHIDELIGFYENLMNL